MKQRKKSQARSRQQHVQIPLEKSGKLKLFCRYCSWCHDCFKLLRNWTSEDFWRNTFKSCYFREKQTMVGAAQTTPQTRPYTVDWENNKHRLGNMFLTFILVLGYAQLTIRSTTFLQGDLGCRIPEKTTKSKAQQIWGLLSIWQHW